MEYDPVFNYAIGDQTTNTINVSTTVAFERQHNQNIVGATEYDPVSNYALEDQTTFYNLKNVLPYNPTPKSILTYDPKENFLIYRQPAITKSYSSKSNSSNSPSKSNASFSKSSTSSNESSEAHSSKSDASSSKSSTSSHKSSEVLHAKSNSSKSSSKSSTLRKSSKELPAKNITSKSSSESNSSISRASTSHVSSTALPINGDSNSSLKSNVPTLNSNSFSSSSTTRCLESKISHYSTPVNKSTSPSVSASSNKNGRSLLKISLSPKGISKNSQKVNHNPPKTQLLEILRINYNENSTRLTKEPAHSIRSQTRECNIFNQQGGGENIAQKKKFADENKKYNISSTNSINDLTRNQDGRNNFHNVNKIEWKSLKRCMPNSGSSKHARKRKKIELSSLSFHQGSKGTDCDVENKNNSPKPHYQAVKMTSLTPAKEMLYYKSHCTPLKQLAPETNISYLTYSNQRDDPNAVGNEEEAHKRRQAATIAKKRLFQDVDTNKNIVESKKQKLLKAIENPTSSEAEPSTQLRGPKASYRQCDERLAVNPKKRKAHVPPLKNIESEETNESEISTPKKVCLSSKTQKLCPQTKTVAEIGTDTKLMHKVVCVPANLQLDDDERSLLSKGLKFVPSKLYCDKYDLIYEVYKYFCKIKSAAYYQYTSQQEKNDDMFSNFKPERARSLPCKLAKTINHYMACCTSELQALNLQPVNESNLTLGEKQALNRLRRKKDIVIMPAEKGGGIFVWKRELYVKKCHMHLADRTIYSLKKTDHTLTTNSKVFKGIKELIQLNLLPKSARNLHLFESDLGESVFYLLGKNPDAPGRPLVSSNSCPTEHIASVLDDIFKTVVASLPSFIKDTDHAIEKLNLISFRPTKPMRIFRLDAGSLYTSIPHKDGLEAVKHYFTKTPHRKLSTDTIVRLTELVLTCNSLEFDGNFYQQIKGVPLGSKMSDSYVSIFMGYLEEKINKNYKGNLPKFYFRCNAEGIGFTYMEMNELKKYITFCKSFYADIKLEYKISNSRVNFLDLRVSVHDDAPFIRTEIVFDPNSCDYLQYTSSHPKGYKEEILESQVSQLRRACSNDNDFLVKAQEMFGLFRQCLYPELQFKKALKHIPRFSRDLYFLRRSKTTTDRLKVFLPYHPHSKSVKDILLRNFNILSSDPDFGGLFKNPPEVIYKPNPSLRDLLVHRRLLSLSPPGTSPCKIKNCKLCQYTFETNSIQFPGGVMRVHEHFTCLSRGVVYVIRCKLCHECYIGQTGVKLSQRAGQHITSIRKKTKCPVAVHFNAPDHRRLEDFSITAVRSCRNTEERKKLENRLIYKYEPIGPKGMNKIFSLL